MATNTSDSDIVYAYWQSAIRVAFPRPGKLIRSGKNPDAGFDETVDVLASTLCDLLASCCQRRDAPTSAFLVFFGTQIYQLLLKFGVACRTSADIYARGCHAIVAALTIGGSRGHLPLRALDPEFSWSQHPDVVHFMRYKIEQNSHLWFAIRPFLCGGSSLARIFGVNDYAAADKFNPEVRDEQPLIQLRQHLGLAPGEDFSTKQNFLRNGHAYEGLGRELCAALAKIRIEEFGTGVSLLIPEFSHSPDGLPLFEKSGNACAMIEVKCHSGNMSSSYATCPNIYLPQNIQGMQIHAVDYCYFTSVYYRPFNENGVFVTVTIEVLYRNSTVDTWFNKVLNEYSASLIKREPTLSPAFWQLFAQTESMLALIKRVPLQFEYFGRRIDVVQAKLNLTDILGSERRLYWSQRTFYRENDDVKKELATASLARAAAYARAQPIATGWWSPERESSWTEILEQRKYACTMLDNDTVQSAYQRSLVEHANRFVYRQKQ